MFQSVVLSLFFVFPKETIGTVQHFGGQCAPKCCTVPICLLWRAKSDVLPLKNLKNQAFVGLRLFAVQRVRTILLENEFPCNIYVELD